ncbi:MAG: hypothetical protein MK132_22915 [Lentisphaerales bacterium]|nr:hypothetical protein [Lentisphaerales bacterium]
MDIEIGEWTHTDNDAPQIFRCPDRDDYLGDGWNWLNAGPVPVYDGSNFGRVKYGWGRTWSSTAANIDLY